VTAAEGEKLANTIKARGSLQVASPSGIDVVKLFHTVISIGAEKYLNYQTFSSSASTTTPVNTPSPDSSSQRPRSIANQGAKKSTRVVG